MDKFLVRYKFTKPILKELKEEVIPTLPKLFEKTEEEEIPPNSFYKASISYLIPKPDKEIARKRETNIHYEHRCKNSM